LEILQIRPGSTAKPELLASYDLEGPNADSGRRPVDWSEAGILAVGPQTLYLMSPGFKTERELVRRHFASDAAAFTKDGKGVLGLYRNTSAKGDEWQLYSIDVATGAEKLVTGVDLPVTTDSIQGFSLHPDGTRFATSIAKWPFDIWMLEGFE
jgi:hypothetical protein